MPDTDRLDRSAIDDDVRWALFQQVANRRSGRQNLRDIVPILGAGFVIQATMEAGNPRIVDWSRILKETAARFRCPRAMAALESDVPGQTTLVWDLMTVELARTLGDQAAHRQELKMRKDLATRLRNDDETRRLARPFVQRFLGLGFHDLASTNFDSVLLPDGVKPERWAHGARQAVSLAAACGPTRIWYPHGHVVEPGSIVLGTRAYGRLLEPINAAFRAHALLPKPRRTVGLDTWVATMLERPIVFIGLSLTREEWTLWWLLSQRARFLARRRAHVPQAFVFAHRPANNGSADALAAFRTLARTCQLLGLHLLAFDDFPAGWERLKAALSGA